MPRYTIHNYTKDFTLGVALESAETWSTAKSFVDMLQDRLYPPPWGVGVWDHVEDHVMWFGSECEQLDGWRAARVLAGLIPENHFCWLDREPLPGE